MALRNIGVEHEVVAISDIDEFAIKSYAAIHDNDKVVSKVSDEEMQAYLEKRNIPLNDKGVRKVLKGKKLQEFYEACVKSNNLGDISKVDPHEIPDHDLFTYSWPCQSISVAGKQKGFEKDSGTRSSLLWECEKVIDVKRPEYLLMENVKALVSKKFIQGFESWLELLESYGYTNYYQVLNAKDYGVPQNRERVFVVSILGDHDPYKFPEKQELTTRLKDVLEHDVDESYYLDDDRVSKLTFNFDKVQSDDDLKVVSNTSVTGHGGGKVYHASGVSPSVLARDYKGPNQVLQVGRFNNDSNIQLNNEPKRLGGIFDGDGKTHQAGAVWDKNGLAPTLDTMQGGWRQPSVIIDDTQGFEEAPRVYKEYAPSLRASRSGLKTIHEKPVAKEGFGRMGKQDVETTNENEVKHSDTVNPFNKTVSSNDGVAPTLTTRPEGFKTAILTIVDNSNIKPINPLKDKTDNGWHFEQQVYDENGITRAVKAGGGSGNIPKVIKNEVEMESMTKDHEPMLIKNGTKKGYLEAYNGDGIDLAYPSSKLRRGRVQTDLSQTITTDGNKGVLSNFRIRKLTPKECWRLMGCSDEDFHKAEQVNSNSQLYKQAGNAIVVDVLEGIFGNLFL